MATNGCEHQDDVAAEKDMSPEALSKSSKRLGIGFHHGLDSSQQGAHAVIDDTETILEKDGVEPIAIVGLSMKFPQDATSAESFWQMILDRRSSSTDYPKDRMNIEAFYDPDPVKLSTISAKGGHFLKEDVRAFDAHFFSTPPSEAGTMDPQHRGLLEATYRALENAGIPMENIAGSDTSVHVGCFTGDFITMNWRDSSQIPKYSATGTAASILSNRLSWFYDLRGPSMTVDTACSSSMVAIDLACNGLWSGQSKIAIVAGANLICSPEMSIALSNMNFLSRDSQCYSFDHRATGYARGEGFGVLILKPVSQAIKDGDTIRALIRSVGSNQDGHTNGGMTQPSKDMQAKLIRETYRKAGLSMKTTRFFEAHGTGTSMGDPIEARAIGESFRTYRSPEEPLYVGAVKSNIGHLEGTSGLAGIIKAVLSLEKGVIPPNTNFEQLNPQIDADFFHLKFPIKSIPWPCPGVRRASVNSFGIGGSNAHVVLDDARHYLDLRNLPGKYRAGETPTAASPWSASNDDKSEVRQGHIENGEEHEDMMEPQLLVWSAADEEGISRLAKVFSQYFRDHHGKVTNKGLKDLAYTLNTRRSLLAWKSYAVIESKSMLLDLEKVISKPVRSLVSEPLLGFVFTGQGAQWAAMGHELLIYTAFKESVRRAQASLHKLGCDWMLVDEYTKDNLSTGIDDPKFGQILCTTVQIALVDLFESFGISPAVVVGHSSGEIAAAFVSYANQKPKVASLTGFRYCAGFLSFDSAVKVAYYRGVLASKLAESTTERNSMISIGLSQSEAKEQIHRLEQIQERKFDASRMTLSCINSPKNVTMSGPEDKLNLLLAHLREQNIFARKLKVNVAYHSPQMREIGTEYLERLGDLEKGSKCTKTLMVSSVKCQLVSADAVCTGQYWVDNMISPVEFFEAMKICCSRSSTDGIITMLDRSHLEEILTHAWVEIGPHSALQGPIREILKFVRRSDEVTYTSALVRSHSGLVTVLETVGKLHCQNRRLQILEPNRVSPFNVRGCTALTDLPEYPFNHSTLHWEESQKNKTFRFREHAKHDLLGAQVDNWNPLEAQWKFIIKADELPWIVEHKINGSILYPAAGMLVMAIEAAKLLVTGRLPIGFEIKNAEFPAPLLLSDSSEGTEVLISLTTSTDSGTKESAEYHYRLFVRRSDMAWDEVCRGSIRADFGRISSDVDGGKEAQEAHSRLENLHRQGTALCHHIVEPAKMYQQLREEIGIEYGPAFLLLDQIRCNHHGEAVATIAPFREPGDTDHQAERIKSAIIHPTTLDGIFQIVFVALTKGGTVPLRTMVPTRIGRLWISCSSDVNPFSSMQQVHTQAHLPSQRSASSSISVFDLSKQKFTACVDEFEMTAISGSGDLSRAQDRAKQICHHMDWKVDLDSLSNYEIEKYCKAAVKVEAEPVEWFMNLDLMVLVFGAKTLQELQEQNNAPVPSMQRYASWLGRKIDQDLSTAAHAKLRQFEVLLGDTDSLNALCEQLVTSKRGELYEKVGRRLSKVLAGEIDPLDLLASDEDLLFAFYEETNRTSQAFNALGRYLDAITHKDPSMKFLEIGAGTGATSAIVLDTLSQPTHVSRFDEYVYTDISPSFFGRAQERFSEHKRIDYRVLNIEDEIRPQGFSEEKFDVVIASNVLHATRSLDTTVRHVRGLLKPGGKLVLMEMIMPNKIRTGFAFGLLPGWWLGSEGYREDSPCISESQWHEVLTRNGFSGTDQVFRDFEVEDCHTWSLMISTAVPTMLCSASSLRINIILDRESRFQQLVAEELTSLLNSSNGPVNTLTVEEASSALEHDTERYIMLLELEKPLLHDLQPKTFTALQTLLASAGGLLWVTRGGGSLSVSPHYGMVQGLFRVSCQENHKVPLVSLALEVSQDSSPGHYAARIVKVWNMTASKWSTGYFEPEYLEIDGLLHINRIVPANYLNDHIFSKTSQSICFQPFGAGPPLKLNVRLPGLLDSLEFVEDGSYDAPILSNEVEVEVRAIGVNFKECLTVLGRVDSDNLGSECTGIITRLGDDCGQLHAGDRVALFSLDTYQSFVRVNATQVVKIPDDLTFTEAAAIPTAFCTAHYSLCEVARLQRAETVLIHAGAGGTGQAAIQVATYIGAEVFATVGSLAKKTLLMDIYELPEDHIFYSRDTSFADGIRRMTQGRGVDVVLNSLSGDALVASWECIAPFGRFVEIGRKDIDSRGSLPMYPFIKNASFSGVDLVTIARERTALTRDILQKTMNLIVAGKYRPAHPLHIYQLPDIEKAFRFLQSGQSSGKIVLAVDKNAMVPTVPGPKSNFSFDLAATYLIAGGLGGIGRSIARWLVGRGAKNLLLISRSGSKGNKKALVLLAELAAKGVNVQCPTCDITDFSSLQSVLKQCSQSMPPIKGCFQASMVLRDATFARMSYDDWRQSTLPKVQGSWNLHAALPKGLDFFILLSSVCGIFGNGGQSNYAAGNTFQDALAEYRIVCGEKATALDLGVILGEGFVAENRHIMDHLLRLGMVLPISQQELFSLLDFYCNKNLKLPTLFHGQVVTGLELPADLRLKGKHIPLAMLQPLFRHMHQMESSQDLPSTAAEQALDLKTQFLEAKSLDEAAMVVSEAIKTKLSKVMGIKHDDIELHNRMDAYGVDSLVAVELRNWLAREVSADIAVFEILGGATLLSIGLTVANKSSLRQTL